MTFLEIAQDQTNSIYTRYIAKMLHNGHTSIEAIKALMSEFNINRDFAFVVYKSVIYTQKLFH